MDLRDVWRPGSGLTLRRLWVLLQGLPGDGMFWQSYRQAHTEAVVQPLDRNRERQAHYAALARGEPLP